MYGSPIRLFLVISVMCSVTIPIVPQNPVQNGLSNRNDVSDEHPYFNSFITKRMEHLSAVKDIKNMKNNVKKYQLVSDVVKEIVHILNKRRSKLVKIENTALEHYPDKDVFKYLEKTAFFCDLLVFFPGITLKLLDVHILWRVTLIDSIQDVMSLNLNFIDENTLKQFDKAYQILSEGVPPHNDEVEQKTKVEKKPERKPRLYSNEL